MSDLYSELLVSRKTSPVLIAVKWFLYIMTGFSLLASAFIIWFLLVFALFAVMDYFLVPRFEVEFEYLHINDEIDVDKIFSKSKRKRAMVIDLNETDLLAPLGSHRLDSYKNCKIIDFSADDPAQKPYVLVTNDSKEQVKILLQLDKNMFENLKRRMPRQVFDD